MDINPYLLLVVLVLILAVTVGVAVRFFIHGLRLRREVSVAARRTNSTAKDYYARTLRQAAEVVDGEANLALTLNVSPEALRRWLEGAESPPIEVHLAALELVTRGTPEEKTE
jgi:DNA-binding transcriptional regulator YiaG